MNFMKKINYLKFTHINMSHMDFKILANALGFYLNRKKGTEHILYVIYIKITI